MGDFPADRMYSQMSKLKESDARGNCTAYFAGKHQNMEFTFVPLHAIVITDC